MKIFISNVHAILSWMWLVGSGKQLVLQRSSSFVAEHRPRNTPQDVAYKKW